MKRAIRTIFSSRAAFKIQVPRRTCVACNKQKATNSSMPLLRGDKAVDQVLEYSPNAMAAAASGAENSASSEIKPAR